MKCTKCLEEKPLGDFSKANTRLGHRRQCKACYAEYYRGYFKSKPEQYKKHKEYVKNNDREYSRQYSRHGLSLDEFEALVVKTDGMCYACLKNAATVIDHDHSCCPTKYSCGDCVRGLLCNGCNSALGHVQDSIDRLNDLALYLSGKG